MFGKLILDTHLILVRKLILLENLIQRTGVIFGSLLSKNFDSITLVFLKYNGFFLHILF